MQDDITNPTSGESNTRTDGLRVIRPYLAWVKIDQHSTDSRDGCMPETQSSPGFPGSSGTINQEMIALPEDAADLRQTTCGSRSSLGDDTGPSSTKINTVVGEITPATKDSDGDTFIPALIQVPESQLPDSQSIHNPPQDASGQFNPASISNAPIEGWKHTNHLYETASPLAGEHSATASVVALSVDSQEDYRHDDDGDSALGDASIYTTSTSVRSSVYQFVEENGRTYHRYREGKYYLPNDEVEQDRLDLQHHLFLLTLSGDLYNAPIKDLPGGLHNVLDIATGTGIWAIEFAYQFPSADVIGTDLSPIQPEFTPPNCHFEVDDAEDPWLFTHPFDYIHGRALATCFKTHQPVIASAFKFLRPGGYLELQDCIVPFRCIDNSMSGTSVEKWVSLIMEGTSRLGKDWTRVQYYKQYLEEAGFVDVVERRYEWPVGTWAKGKREKLLGTWYREDLLSGLQGFTTAVLTRALGMRIEEVEILLAGVRNDIMSNRIHIYIPVRVVYGRRP